jgi:hypothetical protein
MRSDWQLVATGGNGFGLISPFSRHSHLPPIATGCDRSALSEEGPVVKVVVAGAPPLLLPTDAQLFLGA